MSTPGGCMGTPGGKAHMPPRATAPAALSPLHACNGTHMHAMHGPCMPHLPPPPPHEAACCMQVSRGRGNHACKAHGSATRNHAPPLTTCVHAHAPRRSLTGTHSMQSMRLMQSGPQPSPPRQGGLQWQIMMSSSSCCLRLRCDSTLSFRHCHTAGILRRFTASSSSSSSSLCTAQTCRPGPGSVAGRSGPPTGMPGMQGRSKVDATGRR